MRKLFSKFALVATLGFALTFTLSCSGGDDIEGGSPIIGGGSSSSIDNCVGGKGNNIANYRTKYIGDRHWMVENLDYNVIGSKCYNNSEAYRAIYGRLYKWTTAMALPDSCNYGDCSSQISEKHRGICPSGWHVANEADWEKLLLYVDGTDSLYYGRSETAGKFLKATSGWNDYENNEGVVLSGNGTDDYGFTALPGGIGWPDGSFSDAGYAGCWLDYYGSTACSWAMFNSKDVVGWLLFAYGFLQSVRCVQD